MDILGTGKTRPVIGIVGNPVLIKPGPLQPMVTYKRLAQWGCQKWKDQVNIITHIKPALYLTTSGKGNYVSGNCHQTLTNTSLTDAQQSPDTCRCDHKVISPPPPSKKNHHFPAEFYLKGETWLNIGMLYIKLFVMKLSSQLLWWLPWIPNMEEVIVQSMRFEKFFSFN